MTIQEPAAREKLLYLHIGGMKTGSSALQQFLSRNRGVLKKQGVLYPGSQEAHWEFSAEICALRTGDSPRPGMQVTVLLEEMLRSSCRVCVVSSEDFATKGGAAALRLLVPETTGVKIVFYVRRQDVLIESWYNQIVKNPDSRFTGRLDTALIEKEGGMFDHHALIHPWAEAFGRENIIIRCFEKGQMNGDIIQDFTAVTGIVPEPGWWRPDKEVNQSFPWELVEFARLCNIHFPDDRSVRAFLNREFRNSRAFSHNSRRHLLAPSVRRNILLQYEASNQRVAREYLGREDGRLFLAPWPDPDEPWEPYRGLTAEELVPVIAEMIHAAEKRREQQSEQLQPLTTCLEILNHLLKKGIPLVPARVKKVFQEKTDEWYDRK